MHMREHFGRKAGKIVVITVVALAAMGLVTMGLWNWLMPVLFGLKTIGFWQAVGLVLLSKILFGGLRGGPGRAAWRRRMEERWENMTPDERERFREGMRHGWCRDKAPEAKENATK
jgi:hypothetical protein